MGYHWVEVSCCQGPDGVLVEADLLGKAVDDLGCCSTEIDVGSCHRETC